jgi:hypothetical protein
MSYVMESAIKRLESVSDRMSHVTLRTRWCGINVLDVHAPSGDESDVTKDSFCEELERVFYESPKYHIKILLAVFSGNVRRENISELTVRNEDLHEIHDDNGDTVTSSAT